MGSSWNDCSSSLSKSLHSRTVFWFTGWLWYMIWFSYSSSGLLCFKIGVIFYSSRSLSFLNVLGPRFYSKMLSGLRAGTDSFLPWLDRFEDLGDTLSRKLLIWAISREPTILLICAELLIAGKGSIYFLSIDLFSLYFMLGARLLEGMTCEGRSDLTVKTFSTTVA